MDRRRASIDKNKPSKTSSSDNVNVNSTSRRRMSDTVPSMQEAQRLSNRRVSAIEINLESLKLPDSDDGVPEIDHTHPIHSVRRSVKNSLSSIPTYESLLRETTLDEFNREIFSVLQKGGVTYNDGSSEDSGEIIPKNKCLCQQSIGEKGKSRLQRIVPKGQ